MSGDDTLIAIFPKNAREEIRITLDEFKGHRFIGIRIWARTQDGAIPTKSGVSLSLASCPSIIDALVQAMAAAKEKWGEG